MACTTSGQMCSCASHADHNLDGVSTTSPLASSVDELDLVKRQSSRSHTNQAKTKPLTASTFRRVVDTGRVHVFLLCIICPCYAWFCISITSSYLAPWAMNNGISEMQAGILAGISPFAALAGSVLLPFLASRFSIFNVLISGCLLTSFGLLAISASDLRSSSFGERLFILLLPAFFLAGVGEGIMEFSCNILVLEHFPDVSRRMMGFIEGFIGLGQLLGSIFGAVLFQLAGFTVPTLVAAGPNFLLGGWCYICSTSMTTTRNALQCPPSESLHSVVKIDIARSPNSQTASPDSSRQLSVGTDVAAVNSGSPFCFACVLLQTLFSGVIGSSYPALLSIQAINVYGWSHACVGLVLSSYSVMYTIVSLLVGRFSDGRLVAERVFFAGGSFLAIFGLLFNSSSSAGQWTTASTVCGALILAVSNACKNVLALPLLQQTRPSTLKGSGLLVAIFQSTYQFGCMIGPIVLLAACDHYEWQVVVVWVGGVAGIVSLGTVLAFLTRH